MFEYIRNIIPRIQQFSGQLSHIETFVDKPWVLIHASDNTHEYLFLRDRRLILSLNAIFTEGRWELLPTGKLMVNRVRDQTLLEHKGLDVIKYLICSNTFSSLWVSLNRHSGSSQADHL